MSSVHRLDCLGRLGPRVTWAICARYSARSGAREHRCCSSTVTLAVTGRPSETAAGLGVAVGAGVERVAITPDMGVPAGGACAGRSGVTKSDVASVVGGLAAGPHSGRRMDCLWRVARRTQKQPALSGWSNPRAHTSPEAPPYRTSWSAR